MEKVSGEQNCADVLTKHVDRAVLEHHVANLNPQYEQGRADTAPQLVNLFADIIDTRMFFARFNNASDDCFENTNALADYEKTDNTEIVNALDVPSSLVANRVPSQEVTREIMGLDHRNWHLVDGELVFQRAPDKSKEKKAPDKNKEKYTFQRGVSEHHPSGAAP